MSVIQLDNLSNYICNFLERTSTRHHKEMPAFSRKNLKKMLIRNHTAPTHSQKVERKNREKCLYE